MATGCSGNTRRRSRAQSSRVHSSRVHSSRATEVSLGTLCFSHGREETAEAEEGGVKEPETVEVDVAQRVIAQTAERQEPVSSRCYLQSQVDFSFDPFA
jgi:hypothetical protein